MLGVEFYLFLMPNVIMLTAAMLSVMAPILVLNN
jgi:hypothetical protein